MRWWVRSVALACGLVGHARNMNDGRVEVCAQGCATAVVEFWGAVSSGYVDRLSGVDNRRPGTVSCATVQWLPPRQDHVPTTFVEA